MFVDEAEPHRLGSSSTPTLADLFILSARVRHSCLNATCEALALQRCVCCIEGLSYPSCLSSARRLIDLCLATPVRTLPTAFVSRKSLSTSHLSPICSTSLRLSKQEREEQEVGLLTRIQGRCFLPSRLPETTACQTSRLPRATAPPTSDPAVITPLRSQGDDFSRPGRSPTRLMCIT